MQGSWQAGLIAGRSHCSYRVLLCPDTCSTLLSLSWVSHRFLQQPTAVHTSANTASHMPGKDFTATQATQNYEAWKWKQGVIRQYLDSIKPPQRGQLTWAAAPLAPSSIVLKHYVLLKFTAQVASQPQFMILLLRHPPTAKLWHHSTPKPLLGLSICHTAWPCSSVLQRAPSPSSVPSSCEGQCWNRKPGFLHLPCFYLNIILYSIFISILYRGLKRAGRQPHSAKAGGMLHVTDPSTPAALHTGGCAFRKASLRSQRAEGGRNTALTLSAFKSQENPRQNSAWSDQQLHSTSSACKGWHD